MFLGKFESDQRIWDCFVLECFWLRIEVVRACTIKWMQDVLNCWNELSCLRIDERQQLECFQVEGEVFDVLRHFNDTNDQLHKWVDEKNKVRCACIGQCEYPKLHAIVELPTVDVLHCVLGLQKSE